MSHTIGQAKQNNQQSLNSSQADQDSPQPESSSSKPSPLLSDTDYEFLFNQLLEGIAHGWHDRRIVKFFQQLGDRGNQIDWVTWLGRIRAKLLKLPIQSKRRLGTMMIRLGELTQSATEVNQIGAAAQSIGRELLFGNTQSVVWEYDGADIIPETANSSRESEQALSERLPADFIELSVSLATEIRPNSALESIDQSTAANSEELVNSSLPDSPPEHLNNTVASASEFLDNSPDKNSQLPEIEPSAAESLSKDDLNHTGLDDTSNYGEKFEFAQTNQTLEQPNPRVAKVNLAASENSKPDEEINQREQLVNNIELDLPNSLEQLNESVQGSPSSVHVSNQNPVAIDMEEVMNLLQEDDELAQQISQKLSLSRAQPQNHQAIKQPTKEIDQSSLELVESWFNLGLKQVGASEFAKAIVSWEKALNINPNLSEAWHNRGSALGRLGNYEEAVESFQSALTIDPDNYQAWNDRAHALYQLENWAEAVSSWGNAIKIMPGNHLFWYHRGTALEQLEKWQEAISSYEKALEIKPDFQPGRSRYINLVADNSRSN